MANGRVVFDGAPAEFNDAAAQELYGMDAGVRAETRGSTPAGAPSPVAA